MKVPGIYLEATSNGGVTFNIRRPSKVEDAIWEAVQEAILHGWDARRFRMEAAQAWEHELHEQAKAAVKDLQK